MSAMGDTDYSGLASVGSSMGDSFGNTGNSFGFTTGLGNTDSGGLDSLGGSLMGAGAGTVNNGFLNSSNNYLPGDSASGVSAGALNGDTTSGGITSGFSMPGGLSTGSMAQLASQALGQGAKLAQANSAQRINPQGSGRVKTAATNFGNPTVDFAGSNSGSQAGNSLLQLLAKYHPGAAA